MSQVIKALVKKLARQIAHQGVFGALVWQQPLYEEKLLVYCVWGVASAYGGYVHEEVRLVYHHCQLWPTARHRVVNEVKSRACF